MQHNPKKRIIERFNEQQDVYITDADLAKRLFISWLEKFDIKYTIYSKKAIFSTIIHTCTEHLAHILTLFSCNSMYLPVIYYCDLYVRQKKQICVGDLLQLLFVGAIVTMKFWDEEHVDDLNAVFSKLFSMPLNSLLKLEIEMLKTIDYKLYVDESQIMKFKESLKNIGSNKFYNNNNNNEEEARSVKSVKSEGVAICRKRMRLMDDIDYYYNLHSSHYITNNYETKRVKI